MLWALYQQDLNPLGNRLLSTAFAALPVVVLFWLLVPRRWLAPKAGLGGVSTTSKGAGCSGRQFEAT